LNILLKAVLSPLLLFPVSDGQNFFFFVADDAVR
jgi:hypothetical protein